MTVNVVVTGLGIVAPNGLGTEDFWASVVSGKSGIRKLDRFDPTQYPARLAGEIVHFSAEDYLPGRLLPQTDRMTRLALVTAEWALVDAKLQPNELEEFDMGVVTASSSGGFEFGQRELQNLWSKGSQYVSAYQSFAWFYAVNSGQISIRHGLKGPCGVVVSDQAGGIDAVAEARRHVRKGTRLMISGGVDAAICPWGWVAQMACGQLSYSEDPSSAYLPFDARANGYVSGEGGAILIMESSGSASARGTRAYGEIAGYGATFDPVPESGRPPGLRHAIELALTDADVSPGEIDVVFADAAAIPDLDRVEAEAIVATFGRSAVPVTAPKTMTGRLFSGAASLDLAVAFLAMKHAVIPPTINVQPAEHYGIDLVSEARSAIIGAALVLARGYGGFNSAMVLKAVDQQESTHDGDREKGKKNDRFAIHV